MEGDGSSLLVRLLCDKSDEESCPPIRPKLIHDANIFLVKNGLLICSDGRNSFIPMPPADFPILDLLPKLTGLMTVEEICSGFELAEREPIDHLIRLLWENGMLKEQASDDNVYLPDNVRVAFRSQIEFLDHLADRPLERFDRFRRSRVLLAGSGLSFGICAASLVRIGLGFLWLLPTDQSNEDPIDLQIERRKLLSEGLSVSVTLLTPENIGLLESIRDFDLIVYCSDDASFTDILHLNRRSCREGIPLLIGMAFESQSILGPLIKPPFQGCWICGLRRTAPGVIDRDRGLALWRSQIAGRTNPKAKPEVCEPIAEALGHDTAFEIFKILVGHLRPETENGMLFQNLDGPDSFKADFVPRALIACLGHCNHYLDS